MSLTFCVFQALIYLKVVYFIQGVLPCIVAISRPAGPRHTVLVIFILLCGCSF